MKLKLWELAYQDYQQGMKYRDIAEKHGVTLSAVKNWAKRYWKVSKKVSDKSFTPKKVSKTGPPFGNQNAVGHGAPKGNQNAKGNRGGLGCQPGDQIALKTGEFAKIDPRTFTAEEVKVFNQADADPIEQITQTIQLLSVREFRMLKLRAEMLAQREQLRTALEGDLVLDTLETERDGKDYEKTKERRLTEKLLAMEDALTRVQEKKIRAIESRQRMLKDQQAQNAEETIQYFFERDAADDTKD